MKTPRWAPLWQAYSQSLLGFIGFIHEKCSLPEDDPTQAVPDSDDDRNRKE